MKKIIIFLLLSISADVIAFSEIAKASGCDVAVHFGDIILEPSRGNKDRDRYLKIISKKGYNVVRVTDGSHDREFKFPDEQKVILISVNSNGYFFDNYINLSLGSACTVSRGDAGCYKIEYGVNRDIGFVNEILFHGRNTIRKQIRAMPDCNSNE